MTGTPPSPRHTVGPSRGAPVADHWLARPRTLRGMRIGGVVVLALAVLAQLIFPVKGAFGVDDWFGFAAAFGFAVCVAMVLFAKALGVLLKRPQDEYGD